MTVREHTRSEPDAVWHEVMPLWNATGRRADEQADVAFYLRLVAAARRPVVELGVGHGRVARWTRPDYGVDESPRLLRHCAREVPGITLVVARLQDYVLSQPAALSYAPQNLLALVGGPKETLDTLDTIRRNTQRRGQLAFDVAVPQWERIQSRLDRPVVRGEVGSLRLSYRAELLAGDPAAEHAALRMHHLVERLDSSGQVQTRIGYPPVPVDYFSPRRWRHMLVRTGWRVQRCWGGLSGQPLTAASRRQVWLVQR